ncbi:hypothetical protein TraAM80_00459 [Trypanosoma rangeli]|uniref:Uncharacterized protein n=1 Tax=Trypanosoma rangeli TaxID=5698 RepID=A0A3S5ISM3_TRYRA|nr:uncharacterized protein TraAM80_00459 [Trypanosoma rangeli]RNF12178.1 hypothetical protein TraAM80_00459 [Trypanosoma rangeli]|eukprot:RNF12178.1 hypothetical protein TraAM80_00459 [Trypanosoma rangeli]
MLPTSLNDAHVAEGADDSSFTRIPPVLLEDPQRTHLTSSSSHMAFTLSNSLVQFLSPLQLQGFASRLIESCGVHHVDELAARVTCEDDVEELLGSHASLQQRRDLWKGVCKWKRTAGKRVREPTRKADKTKALVGRKFCDADVLSEVVPCSMTGRFIDLDKCTPSQFIRQFAFCGRQETETNLVTGLSAEKDTTNAVETVTREADGAAATTAIAASLEVSPHSSSWTSSVNPLGSTPFRPEKRYRREDLPISALTMGLGMETAGRNDFEVGETCCEGDEPRRNSVSLAVPLEAEGEVVDIRQPIEECFAEYEVMREAMCVALSNAVETYNEGLRALQERLRALLAATATKRQHGSRDGDAFAALETAARLDGEPSLRVEMHPAGPQQTGKVSFYTHAPHHSSERMQSVNKGDNCLSGSAGDNPEFCGVPRPSEANNAQLRPSLMCNTTFVSPFFANMGDDALPSLSDMTSPSRGSYRRTEKLSLEEYERRRTATLQNCPHEMSRLATNDTSQGIPAAFSLDEESTVPFPSNMRHESIAGVTAERETGSDREDTFPPHSSAAAATCPLLGEATADLTHQEPLEPCDTFFLDDFGLQAVSNEVAHSTLRCPAQPEFAGEVFMSDANPSCTAMETQVIDVDALSSLESDTNEERLIQRPQGDNDVIPVDDCSEQVSARSSPMALHGGSSQEEHIWMCSQLPRERQRAVSRSSSLCLEELGNAHMDSVSMSMSNCPRGLDWTTYGGIAADAQDLFPTLHPNADKTGQMSGSEHNMDEEATVLVVGERDFSPLRSLAPEGLPPMPSRSLMNTALPHLQDPLNDTADELTTEGVMNMDYDTLHQWCLRLGLRILYDEAYATDTGEEASYVATGMEEVLGEEDSRDNALTQGENSNGWWLGDGGVGISGGERNLLDGDPSSRSPQRPPRSEGGGTTTPLPFTPGADTNESEWRGLQRAALMEQMRETLRLFITRRQFMFEVVPFFFHRLPRFSGGDAYKPVRAADLVRSQLALTRQELEEQRRLAKMKETEEVACCVITSLAAEAAESIERQAVFPAKGKDVSTCQGITHLPTSMRSRSPQRTCVPACLDIPLYEQLLLMEPTDVQAVTSLVQADFPHVSRHRVEALLEESGIPLGVPRRMRNTQSDGGGELNATQRSASSCSPPPDSPIVSTQTGQTTSAQESKRRFFAQRAWAQRRRNR